MKGILYIVATPIGNMGDITFRAVDTLRSVDIIVAEDTRQTRKLTAHFDIHVPMTSFFKGNEGKKTSLILQKLADGNDVALVSDGGTPCISDPGYPLIKGAIENEIRVVPIPGASAVISALSSCGLPVNEFTFVGFLPNKTGKRKKAIGMLSENRTSVIYLSPWKALRTIKECLEILGDRRVCLCREMTKIHEEFMRGRLSDVLKRIEEKGAKGEMVLIVAPND